MRLPRADTPAGRTTAVVLGGLFRGVIRGLARTWRIEVVAGGQHVDALRSAGTPFIVTVWHNRIVMAVPFLKRRFLDAGVPIAVLTSASRDGELVARTLAPWGVHAVRGSSTRGGSAAVRGTLDAIRRLGASPIVVPDGPQGPPYRFKAGAVHLGRLSGAPLVAIGLAADRYWSIGSWDRLMVPRPFARVTVVVDLPRAVDAAGGRGEADAERALHERNLLRATQEAETATGVAGSLRLPDPDVV